MPIAVENELLRILQESLSNIDKHAGADARRRQLGRRGRLGCAAGQDDGKGFDTARGIRDNAYGLGGHA